MSLRVAHVLDLFIVLRRPRIFGKPAATPKQVSILNLDEYRNLLQLPDVKHKGGVQFPFGPLSSKPTAWVHFLADLDDMADVCPHSKRTWFSESDGSVVSARHHPTLATTTYSLTNRHRAR